MFSIEYYNEAVQRDILALPAPLLARYAGLTRRMTIDGPNLAEPHTKAFGDGLFELRLKATNGIARVFYCTLVGRRIVMLHGSVKKTQTTPVRHRRLAEIRMRNVKKC
ncbi:hypothetical protein PTE30175_01324 [Pandoraea terrae]|uniref:Type II toxin-antitoxin system RelE/ParE family toxin n=1 Tax=Pandoraea terrae TaxID=1537710 RepID=A0A5E4TEF6_9BURK|nr:type II toxin-antitoxin system RelE/ParE family toxin [Pandoraea terrae]VVD86325.1 hypothetical protein PTE30175_01324 [Pandoraea terrae]